MIVAQNLSRSFPWLEISVFAAAVLVGCRSVETTPEIEPSPSDVSPAPAVTRSPMALDAFAEARIAMVRDSIEARGIDDGGVLRAMRTVPRHEFVPPEYLGRAYEDHPLPIGYGQTISQPYVVAWMTQLLRLKPGEKVLEIGTGSGYQAAVLAELGFVSVYTVEIVPELTAQAARRLATLGYDEVEVRQDDGYFGWPEAAPFDAIIVTAAPDHLPAPLAEQLAEGGRLVIPIGPPGLYQSLWQFVKEQGELTAYNMGTVRFVPFMGGGVQQVPQETEP